LAPILNQYKELPLGPDQLSNLEMGYIYEELLRRFSEQSGDEAGEHFTPREVIRLMVELLDIPIPDRHISIYDPACGTGGMLSVAKEHLLDRAATPAQRANVEKLVTVHGQELSPTNYAICQADLLIKNDKQAKVFLGNSLIPHVRTAASRATSWPARRPLRFHAQQPALWRDLGRQGRLRNRSTQARKTRYRAGMPRVNDGALLFLQTMLAKMKPAGKTAAAASPSSSTARRCPMATAVRAKAKSAAGFSKTTGSTPSSCCPTSSSTTPASSPTSGCCATTSPPSHKAG
jgi:type I restriction enzyme M protein